MKLRIAMRILLVTIGLLAAAAPSYAGWGAFSGYAFAAKNQSVSCAYNTSSGVTLGGILAARRNVVSIAPFGNIIFDDAVFYNVLAKANVFMAGYDSKSPNNGSNWPIMSITNGLAAGQTLDFGTVTNENFQDLYNLQAGCEVGN